MQQLMIVLIPYINLSNLSWIKEKCQFLRNMERLELDMSTVVNRHVSQKS